MKTSLCSFYWLYLTEIGKIHMFFYLVPSEYYVIVNCLKKGTTAFVQTIARGIYNVLEEIKIWTYFHCS